MATQLEDSLAIYEPRQGVRIKELNDERILLRASNVELLEALKRLEVEHSGCDHDPRTALYQARLVISKTEVA